MPHSSSTRAVTVRLPEELYIEAARVARKQEVSLNSLMQSSLTDAIRVAEERERYEMYAALGQDEDCDVEYAIYAQAEVMLANEP